MVIVRRVSSFTRMPLPWRAFELGHLPKTNVFERCAIQTQFTLLDIALAICRGGFCLFDTVKHSNDACCKQKEDSHS